ncbi:MFS transporter [Sphingopyxis sp. SCN 67-31]|uniref:MFS transporter n=1 Tax=Sphingopyxis sp. SCN 67-31 TaxID=1660142 RepID=UPI00257B7317|nr:MFS transporter [Sphingopyxis sp. SCN 67-31]
MAHAADGPIIVTVVDKRTSAGALVADGLASLATWYQFGFLGLVAGFVGRALLPTFDDTIATLVILAIFALGFFTRPIGGALSQKFAAQHGGKFAQAAAILLMSVSSVLIGLLPDFTSGGYAGIVMLVALRLTQGIAAGAEMTGPVGRMAAMAPNGQRGLLACWPMVLNLSGYTLSAGVALFLVTEYGEAAVYDGSWRLGFFVAFPLAILIGLLRFGVDQSLVLTEVAVRRPAVPVAPAAEIAHWRPVLLTLGGVLVYNATTGAFQVGVPWLVPLGADWSLADNLRLALLFGIGPLTFPLFGLLVDRWGASRLLGFGAVAVALAAYPVFSALAAGRPPLTVIIAGIVLMGVLGGAIQAFLAERLPDRSPRVQLTYAMSAAIFGGTSPMIICAIAALTADPAAGSSYLVAAGAVSCLCILVIGTVSGSTLPKPATEKMK